MKKDNKKTELTEKQLKEIDASNRTLGRVASEVAFVLMGKNSPSFERHKYSGFRVKVLNISKIKITNKKLEEIVHKTYSGYPGGLKIKKGTNVVEKKGHQELLKHAVYQMLPSNKLRREMMKNLIIEN